MTANPGGGDYRPDEIEFDEDALTVCIKHRRFVPCRKDEGCVTSQHPVDVAAVRAYQDGDTPVSVAQDATDATETPARTPGGSGTAEARTEAQGERGPWVDRHGDVWTLNPDGLTVSSPETATFTLPYVEKKWGPLREPTERESGTDPGMTSEDAELAALRARVADLDNKWHEAELQWASATYRADMAEAKVARVEAAFGEPRNHADWCSGMHYVDCCGSECDCHISTFRKALDGA